jgi:murein DD-endopeptidase MepM/ murein hydrolase activator NlpD
VTSGYQIVTPVDCPVMQGSDGTFSHGGKSPGFYAIDYGCTRGTPCRAAADGIVGVIYRADWNPVSARTGPSIWIDHGNGYSTFSCHMSRIDVATGDHVTQGQIIGLTGDPAIDGGFGSGAHLHWEIWDSAKHLRVRMEDLEAAGIAGPWHGAPPIAKDTGMFTIDGQIDDGRLDAVWFGTDAPTKTQQETMPRFKGHGIPDRWEVEFRKGRCLGAVRTREKTADATGAVIQYFASGWIVWYPDGTTSVN